MLLKNEVYEIINCSLEVLKSIGHGLHEKPYENALAVEFNHRAIPHSQQQRFPVTHRSIKVGEFIPDLIAYNQIIIDTKTIEKITNHERGQMLNYLRITKKPLGLIINFKHQKLEWERIILSENLK